MTMLQSFQPEGNYYDKYGSKNPVVKLLMQGFFKAFDGMLHLCKESIAPMGGHILEAGCGEGHVTRHIWEYFSECGVEPKIVAFDLSDKLIQENKIKISAINFFRHNIYEPINEADTDGAEQFDLIVCSEVLEHLEDPERAVRRLMEYGDRFIFSVPNEPIWRMMNMARFKYVTSLGNTPGHIQHFSAGKFRRMLEGCGLTKKKMSQPLPWIMVYCIRDKNS